MLFLLRKIRRKLMEKNKFTTYLLYALGEIFLVVIGILIAVSINNWNQKNQQLAKEKEYLADIKISLQEDIDLTIEIIKFDSAKTQAAIGLLKLFGSGQSEMEMKPQLPIYLNYLFELASLDQSRVAFDNMISAESIGIISDKELRAKLGAYYSISFVGEERTIELTRTLTDQLFPFIADDGMIRFLFNEETNVKPKVTGVKFYENPVIISTITTIAKNLEYQVSLAREQQEKAQELIQLINEHIE